jgi:hypothetical protein
VRPWSQRNQGSTSVNDFAPHPVVVPSLEPLGAARIANCPHQGPRIVRSDGLLVRAVKEDLSRSRDALVLERRLGEGGEAGECVELVGVPQDSIVAQVPPAERPTTVMVWDPVAARSVTATYAGISAGKSVSALPN